MQLKFKSDIEEFGTLSILNEESTGGRPMEAFLLNEEQAIYNKLVDRIAA